MRENNFITESIRKANSLTRYSIRIIKDTYLYDDVEYFLFHHQHSTSELVEKLLKNDFLLARISDSSYPIL